MVHRNLAAGTAAYLKRILSELAECQGESKQRLVKAEGASANLELASAEPSQRPSEPQDASIERTSGVVRTEVTVDERKEDSTDPAHVQAEAE